MAVIKCSNCKNEILDTEIVCPYCDCPISETIKKMQNDDLENYSIKSIDGLTGKIPAITMEEPKLATSSDFQKEKAAILKDIDPDIAPAVRTEAPKEAPPADVTTDKTVKISKSSMPIATKAPTAEQKKNGSGSTPKKDAKTKKSPRKTDYIVMGITLVVIVLVVYIIWGIVSDFTTQMKGKKKETKGTKNQTDIVQLEKDAGFKFHSGTLTITDDKVMKAYTSSIETPWYENIDSVKHITIGKDVTKIGDHAFEGFLGLVDLTLPSSLETIGDYAFKGCTALEKIIISDTSYLEKIGEGAFEGCKKLESISGYTKDGDPEPTVEIIGDRAFAKCAKLQAMRLPMYTEIGNGTFSGVHKDFVIICESSGDVYDWAKENDIPTKTSFSGDIVTEDPVQEPQEKPEEKPAEKPAEPQTPQPPAQTEAPPAASLTQLMDQLSKAATQAEKDKILAEIDKLTR